MYLEFIFGDPGKFTLSVKFSFSKKGNRFFHYNFRLGEFCCVLFLIHDEYGIGLKVDFLNRSTFNGYLGIESIMESVKKILSVRYRDGFFLHLS